MEREGCDQDIVMGKALREDKALNAAYFALFPKLKHLSVAVKKVRSRFEYHFK